MDNNFRTKIFTIKNLMVISFVFVASVRVIAAENNYMTSKINFKKTLSPQQSTTGKYRPDNVSIGITEISPRNQVLISDVPSYLWQHGCGPTALGMVIGYYDNIGFSDLIIGDASSQTINVDNAIANSKHYSDYSEPIDYYPDLFPDLSELGGAHTSNCLADFMKTSWSIEQNRYGWSWSNMIGIAFVDYVQMCNNIYNTYISYEWFSGASWEIYKTEIEHNRPVVLLVDSNGDGYTDHFVTGIGYDDSNLTYGIYDTWDNSIHWYQWRGMSNYYSWGIYGFSILEIEGNLEKPSNITIDITGNEVTVSWDSVSGANSYIVLCSDSSDGTYTQISEGENEFSFVGNRINWTTPISDPKQFYIVKASVENWRNDFKKKLW